MNEGVLQDVNNPEATGAIIAAGATSAVRVMLEQNARMHVLLLAITPRGERCATLNPNPKIANSRFEFKARTIGLSMPCLQLCLLEGKRPKGVRC